MKNIKLVVLVSLLLFMTSCMDKNHNSLIRTPHSPANHIVEKRVLVDDSWVYYYFIYNNFNSNIQNTPTSYYTSSTPISSFKGQVPTPITEATPKEVVEAETKGETVSEVNGEVDMETGKITEQLELDLGAPPTVEIDTVEINTTSDTTSDTTSTDSGSGDSGGGGSSD